MMNASRRLKIVEFKKRIREADAILFVTPEYNYSIPGGLKNAIDWASRPYGDNAWNGQARRRSWARPWERSARREHSIICAKCFVFLNVHAINQPEVMIANAGAKFRRGGKPDQ